MSEKLQHKKRLWRANSNQKSFAPEERGLLTVKMLNKNQETTMREGLRACKRVAFLRRRHKNAECIARCIRFPGAMPRARGNNWALHNVGCARHSPNKFGSALACTTFQPAQKEEGAPIMAHPRGMGLGKRCRCPYLCFSERLFTYPFSRTRRNGRSAWGAL